MSKFKYLSRVMAFALVVTALPVRADLNTEMQSYFSGIMTNATPFGQYVGQRRGVITGGSVVIRNSVMNPNLISFVPPGIKAGCNGIDLFGGSFSYINSAQFTQLLRSIAQAAVGYAFQLAIEGMCPTCAQVMAKLQKDIAQINSLMRDSCETGKRFVEASGLGTTIRGWADERNKEAAVLNTKTGFIDDFFAATEEAAVPPTQTAVQSGNPVVINQITGNVVWQALQESDTASWYANGDQQMLETLMSLTGTVIANPNAANTDIKYDFRPNLIKVRDFIEGGDVEIYKCESEACLLPNGAGDRQTITLTGLRSRARLLLFGSGNPRLGFGGIVDKLYAKGNNAENNMTQDEINFIRGMIPGVYGLMRSLATERISVGFYADQVMDVVTTEMAHKIIDDMFDSITKAVLSTGKPMDTQVMAMMKTVREQINESRRVNGENIQGITSALMMHRTMRDSLRQSINDKAH